MKKIGILGGMGPQASLHFYKMLIEEGKQNIKGPQNNDYPYLLLSSIPVPDIITGKNNIKTIINMVNQEARNLEKAGAHFLVMPCNTMHLLKQDILKGVNIPFISMVDSVVHETQKLGIKKVGLLGSSTTMQSELYISPLRDIGIDVIIPDESEHNNISQTIQNYISGNPGKKDIELLLRQCDTLLKSGSESIILGCTELPLILKNNFKEYHFLSSSHILAKKTLKHYKNVKT